MKTYKLITSAVVAAGMLAGVPLANAINITIPDNNTGSIVGGTPYTETNTPGWYQGGTMTGPQTEYGEVEPGMQTGSQWDLAAFVTPSIGALGIISGYDLKNGDHLGDNTHIGDIFVSLSGAVSPLADPNTAYTPTTTNATYGYDFAIHMDFGTGTYSVYALTSSTVLDNGEYAGAGNYNSASQPVSVDTHQPLNVVATGSMYYSSTESDAQDSAMAGFTISGAYNYYAQVGTSWLVPYLSDPNNASVLYKLTMSCGNDNMLGLQTTGFKTVPDGSATLTLLGVSLLALAGIAKMRTRRSVR